MTKKKIFDEPAFEVVRFAVEDVITASWVPDDWETEDF